MDSNAASPLSPHFAGGIPNGPSPPPSDAGVRRHQSLNYATNVRRLGTNLKRAGTLQAAPPKGHPQQGLYSGAQSPSPTGAEEEYEAEGGRADDGYFHMSSQQVQGQYSQTSPIGRSSPWGTPGNDWKAQIGANVNTNMGSGVDDVSRALSALEINQQYGGANAYQQGRCRGIRGIQYLI